MTTHAIGRLRDTSSTPRHRLRNLSLVFAVLGAWTWVLASMPAAVDQRLEQQEATAEPLVSALRARNELSPQNTPTSYLAPRKSQELVYAWPPEGKTYRIEVSCYTGIESHGADGRNDWSAATYRFPQGTWLDIEGFGEKRVETVTAEAYAHRVDVWFGETQEDYDRCIEFGTKMLNVTVL